MAVSNSDIQGWLAQNAGASDTQIRSAMDQYGVSAGQMASATGVDVGAVQQRYDAAAPAQGYAGLTGTSGAIPTANAYQQYLGEVGSVDTAATRKEARDHLFNLGMGDDAINKAYQQYLDNQPAAKTAQNFKPFATQFADPTKYDQQNPYLQQMGDAITGQVNDNLTRNLLPQISSSAVASGNFGGSRQGVVEANAFKDANQGLSNSLTQMRYGDYNDTMNRQMQRYGMDQNYNLGLGNLQLGNKNSDQGFYGQQRGQDLQQLKLGADIFQQGSQGVLQQGQGVYDLGLRAQQAPWQAMEGFNGAAQPYTGTGSTSNNQSGSAAAGAIAGAVTGSQVYNIYSK